RFCGLEAKSRVCSSFALRQERKISIPEMAGSAWKGPVDICFSPQHGISTKALLSTIVIPPKRSKAARLQPHRCVQVLHHIDRVTQYQQRFVGIHYAVAVDNRTPAIVNAHGPFLERASRDCLNKLMKCLGMNFNTVVAALLQQLFP